MAVAQMRRCARVLARAGIAAILLSGPVLAIADDAADAAVAPAKPKGTSPYGGLGISFGTTGFGVNYRYGLNRFIDLRAGYQFGTYSHSFDKDNNHYDGSLRIHAATLMADIKPFAGGFRISTGLYTGSPAIKLNGSGQNQYDLGDAKYNGDLKLKGGIDLGNTAPYLGLGWGGTTNGHGFGMTFDAGVMFTHSPKVALDATGTACDATNNSACDPNGPEGFNVTNSNDPNAATFQQNRLKEIAKIEDDSKNYKFWPVINLGLVYRF